MTGSPASFVLFSQGAPRVVILSERAVRARSEGSVCAATAPSPARAAVARPPWARFSTEWPRAAHRSPPAGGHTEARATPATDDAARRRTRGHRRILVR